MVFRETDSSTLFQSTGSEKVWKWVSITYTMSTRALSQIPGGMDNARSRRGITNLYHSNRLGRCFYARFTYAFQPQTAKTQDLLWNILSAGGYAK